MKSVGNPHNWRLRGYLSGAVLYGAAIAIYAFLPYYRGFISRSDLDISYLPEGLRHGLELALAVLGTNTYNVIIHLYVGYLIVGFWWFLFSRWARDNSRTVVFWRVVGKIMNGWRTVGVTSGTDGLTRAQLSLSDEEKATTLFFLVKFFFVPVMLNFLFANFGALLSTSHTLLTAAPSEDLERNRLIYFAILNFMLVVDTGFFVLGYLFEFPAWRNDLRSVEPTIFGWIVALCCYPPFNGFVTQGIGWGSSDFSVFPSPLASLVTICVSLVLFGVYTWATVALGLKASNLTNRGIVRTGPYAYVRHPAYVCKNLHWLVMGLPLIAVNWLAALSIAGWAMIYLLRAITEERHLLADPQYQHYCKEVPYRFIPNVI